MGRCKENHGLSNTKTWITWVGMKNRCLYVKDKRYHRYGGRGIKICDRWANSFMDFYKDMGERPEGMQIDRINNDGDYEPGNCRWVKSVDNTRNNSRTILNTEAVKAIKYAIKYMGYSNKRIADAYGISRSIVENIKYKKSWSDIKV